MDEPKPRPWTALIPVSGVVGFVLLASVVSGNIFVFYSVIFIALVCIAGWLLMRPGPDA